MTCHPRLAILLSLLTVTACSVRGTDIEPVEPGASPAFDAAADAALVSTLPVDAWWTTFGDARVTRSWSARSVEALTHVRRGRW